MTVEAGKVREFALAVRSSDPDHLGPQPVSTPTFLQAGTWWMREEHSPWAGIERDWSRLLHGEQEFIFHGAPPAAGDELEGTARIDRVYTKAGKRGGSMTFTDVVIEYRDAASGRLVAEVRTTSIETSQSVSTDSTDSAASSKEQAR